MVLMPRPSRRLPSDKAPRGFSHTFKVREVLVRSQETQIRLPSLTYLFSHLINPTVIGLLCEFQHFLLPGCPVGGKSSISQMSIPVAAGLPRLQGQPPRGQSRPRTQALPICSRGLTQPGCDQAVPSVGVQLQ